VLLNRWAQLALITPVMFWTGWPIHRTGWLALSGRRGHFGPAARRPTIRMTGPSPAWSGPETGNCAATSAGYRAAAQALRVAVAALDEACSSQRTRQFSEESAHPGALQLQQS
jgi:hypothetical protein